MCVRVCVCVSECMLLTTMLKIVAGTRQRSPGSHNSTADITVVITLARKACIGSTGSLMEVFSGIVNVCCVATMGI